MGASAFKDHFSHGSADYARGRPEYPEALFDFLADLPAARDTAWDCGTGTGQAARSLASRFRTVAATDASASQAATAERETRSRASGPASPAAHPDRILPDRILYAAAAAERVPLRNESVDLVTVAQALHWFDFPAFFAEARRVLRPGGFLAAWCYGNCSVTPEVDKAYARLYADIVGPYWPPERAHIEDGYASIPFPFAPLPCPGFAMEARWDLEGFLAYLETWSAVKYYRKDKGADPIALVRGDMKRAWGGGGERRLITWPLSVKAGRFPDGKDA